MNMVAVFLQANLRIVVEGFFRIIVKAGGIAEGAIWWIKIEKRIVLSIVEGGFEVTCQNLHMFK